MPTLAARIVEVYVFRMKDGTPEYLLLKRAANEAIYPGIWQVVTGTLLEGERALDGARRELSEETGLTIRRLWTIPGISTFFDPGSDTVHFCPMFAVEVPSTLEPVMSSEHQMFGWFELERARGFVAWPSQRDALQTVHAFIASDPEHADMTLVR